ncbi:uncharacterized protein Dmul_18590 [Desulfococcus multivorans]|nr:uncharacterized protein Dmul_18590 [Desulfococcus multivorans]
MIQYIKFVIFYDMVISYFTGRGIRPCRHFLQGVKPAILKPSSTGGSPSLRRGNFYERLRKQMDGDELNWERIG